MFRYGFSASLFVLAGMILLSCGKQSPSPDSNTPVTPKTNVAQEAEIANEGENLVKNGSFEIWKEKNSAPEGWSVMAESLLHQEADNASDGNMAVKLSAMQNRYNWIDSYLDLPASAAGKTMIVTVKAKTDMPGCASMKIGCEINKAWQEHLSPYHPGDGKWHTLAVKLDLPGDYPGGKIKVEGAVLATSEKVEAAFDDFRLTVK